jgi:fatty-acyl-CoA synthase
MVGMTLTLNASRYSDELAIVFGSVRLTYGQLNARACQVANALASIGIRKGDRVAVLLHNGHQFIESFFGAAKIGAIFVPVNFRLAKPEIDEVLADCTARVLIYGSEFAEAVESLSQTTHFPEKVIHVEALREDSSAFDTGPEYDSWIANHPTSEPRVEVAAADDQLVVYSSGTTGRPKGAVWTHANTLCSSMAKIIDFQLTPKDTTVVFGPLFHVGPLMDLAVPVLLRGGKLVLGASRGFDPAHLLETIEVERATVVSIYPTMWRRVLALSDLDRFDLSHLRLFFTGGEPMPQWLLRAIYDRFPTIPFINTYGCTEGGPIASFLAPEDRYAMMGSIGKSAFAVEIRIVDDHGREAAPGVPGELAIRSPVVCKGYWRKPEETEAALREGWWHTGDLAWKDEEGFLWIAGRKKDLIISGAENIYPVEIERVISMLDGVAEVAVVGVPDEHWGETAAAFVVRRPGGDLGEAAVIDHCRENLASYKKPRHVFFLDELPRTPVGKVSKEVLRQKGKMAVLGE